MNFSIYKPGQGKYARIGAGILLLLLTLYGVSSLRSELAGAGVMFTLAGQAFTWAQVLPVLVFLIVAAAGAWAINYPKAADFLIETEIEMGRVVWPTKRAVTASSIVVIVTVVVMSLLLFAVDYLLRWLLTAIGLY